jgi:ankyrin repeat protein
MPEKSLPVQPNLEQYKKQAKTLLHSHAQATPESLERIARNHPRFHHHGAEAIRSARFQLADAQLVIAREHGFESWPKFVKHIETLLLTRAIGALEDPVAAFIQAACVPLAEGHSSGTLDEAELILANYPEVTDSNIYSAAAAANETAVRAIVARDPSSATAKGGPRNWDALTYLCFSRYLRLDRSRSGAFVGTARALLDAGANANTGWIEMIDHPNPRPILEAAIYGAAGIAQHAELTRLLLECGADPNDEETPYHVAETRDNKVLEILLASGKLNDRSMSTLLIRKCDWHDPDGLRLVLEHGADPNAITVWGVGPLHQAVRRDNSIGMIECLLDHGADPSLPNRDGKTPITIAAQRGRAAALDVFEQRRGTALELTGADALLAACARDQKGAIEAILASAPDLGAILSGPQAGTALAEFAGNGNVAGVQNLLDLGVPSGAIYREGDGYFGIAKMSTALHVAAWRAWPQVVKELILRGAPVNATDSQGRTALQLAVKACVDSFWTQRRSPDSVQALLEAGASTDGIKLPTGYDEIDRLLRPRSQQT